jgi:hypothetical protein
MHARILSPMATETPPPEYHPLTAPRAIRLIAQRAMTAAVTQGLIERPEACSRCGAGGRKVEGHHADYSRPFHVEWLCTPCHQTEHQGLRDDAGIVRSRPKVTPAEQCVHEVGRTRSPRRQCARAARVDGRCWQHYFVFNASQPTASNAANEEYVWPT